MEGFYQVIKGFYHLHLEGNLWYLFIVLGASLVIGAILTARFFMFGLRWEWKNIIITISAELVIATVLVPLLAKNFADLSICGLIGMIVGLVAGYIVIIILVVIYVGIGEVVNIIKRYNRKKRKSSSDK